MTFTASGSDYDDGDVLTYAWDLDGNGTYETDTGTETATSTSYSTVGTRTVRVRVSDGTDTAGDSVAVTVVNRGPNGASFSLSPSAPKTLETVTFTGSGSDPDGDPLSYAWEWDGDDDFNDALTQSASRSFPTPGNYTVKLRVTDSYGASLTVGTTGNVAIANRPPAAAFTASPSAPLTGQTVTFDSTTSSDLDGTVASRAWDLDNDGAFDDGAGVTAARAFGTPGSHPVRLRVTDNNGGTTTKTVTIDVGNRAPAADFVFAPAAPVAGQGVTLDASTSTDPEGFGLALFEWDFEADGTFDATGPSPGYTKIFTTPGTYTVKLRVTDAHGGQAETTRTVVVAAPQVVDGAGAGGTGGGVATTETGGQTGGSGQATLSPPAGLAVAFGKQRLRRALAKGFAARARCASSCKVVARLVLAGRAAAKLGLAKSSKPTIVASGAITTTGSGESPLVLRFTRKAKRALSRLRSARLTLVVTPSNAAGSGPKLTKTVALR